MSVVVGSGIEDDGVGALGLRGMSISFSMVMAFWPSEVGALHEFGQHFGRGHACEGAGLTPQEPKRLTQGSLAVGHPLHPRQSGNPRSSRQGPPVS